MGGGKKPPAAFSNEKIDLPFDLRRKKDFHGGHFRLSDMTKFVKALDNRLIIDEFILLSVKEEHVRKKMTDILEYRFSVHDNSFTTLAVPLLKFLTSSAFVHSAHAMDTKNIYALVFNTPLFYMRMKQCFTDAISLYDAYYDILDLFTQLLYTLLKKIPKAMEDEDFYQYLYSLTEWVHSLDHRAASAVHRLDDAIALCIEFIPSRKQPQVSNHMKYALELPVRGAKRKQFQSAEAQPQHDNAFEDFHDIRILPTNLEMRSLELPVLPLHPKNVDDDALTYRDHLDFHFRLLREDALAQMRNGLQWYLNPTTPPDQRNKPPRHLNLPRLNVAEGLQLYRVKGSQRHGILVEISAPQPVEKSKIREFWKRDSRYTPGSLVCLAFNVDFTRKPQKHKLFADLACDTMIFATVAERDEASLVGSKERFRIALKLLDPREIQQVVRALTKRGHHVLVEVRSLFFTSYAPVLKSLQSMEMLDLPPELQECLFTNNERMWSTLPEYLRSGNAFNLQFLVKPGYNNVDLRSVRIENRQRLEDLLRHYQAALKLDGSQIQAFSAAMTQQVCLIQGPPGTGKSYVGTKIIQALVQQKNLDVGPILCVCYTNHALDQFLESLLEERIVYIDEMVRLGSRSKCPQLEDANLFTLRQKTQLSRQEGSRRYQLKSMCREIEDTTLKELDFDTGSRGFMKWVQSNYEDEFEDICRLHRAEDGDEGFEEQDQKMKEANRWVEWQKGEINEHLGNRQIWKLPLEIRQQVLEVWREEFTESKSSAFAASVNTYQRCVEKMNELQIASEKRIMQEAKIVGMTTTGCAMHQELVRCLAPKVVLIEEAGEVLEAHLLSCLTSATQHIIQIGDHMQLRPLVNEYSLSYQSQRRFDLDVSMFERLVDTPNSIVYPQKAAQSCIGKLVTLSTQRRMAPDICDLIRFTLYPSLEDAPNVQSYPSIKGFEPSLWFFDHNFRERGDDISHQNPEEAQLTVDLAHYALLNGTSDIVILTPYLGQLKLLRERLGAKHVRLVLEDKDIEALRDLEDSEDEEILEPERQPSVDVKTLQQCIRLSTVDNFQGNEADFVLVSTVRSNEQGSTGFLKVFNRVNVMLSRARHGMVILGSAATLRQCRRAQMFQIVLDILEDKQLIGNYINLKCETHGTVSRITSSKDMQTYVPYGGCQLPCNARLPCGHVCAKLCHPDDLRHKTNVCFEPCMREIALCGHLCNLKCCDTCRCTETLPAYSLACGHHVLNVKCALVHNPSSKIPCPAKVRVQMPTCHHEVELKCQDAIELATARQSLDVAKLNEIRAKCPVVCNKRLPCDHPCASPCGACFGKPEHVGVCKHPCERTLPCGHSCRAFCHPANQCPPCDLPCATKCTHSSCPELCKAPCNSCSESCTWTCSHSETTCPLPCGSPCIRLPCDKRCEKTLSCGHQCPGLCGESCMSKEYCRQCGKPSALDQVVDLIMQTTLRDHDPDESPLVQWPCGHCFTIESMDGYLNLNDYFVQHRLTGQWVDFRPLTLEDMESQRKSCPLCRFPLFAVHRYSRILNFHSLYENELKYLKEAIATVEASRDKRRVYRETMALKRVQKWQRDMLRQSSALAPSQKMATKERHYFEKAKLEDLNLHRYRNKMQSKAQTMLLMEALEVSLLVVRSMIEKLPKSNKPNAQLEKLMETMKEAETLAAKGVELCTSLSSWRSAVEFQLLLMKLYFIQLQCGHYDSMEIQAKLKATFNTVKTMKMCTQELGDQAQEIFNKAMQMTQLTKEEKNAIFQAFGDGQANAGYGGFGGHWYQCPNGHPYVITECGGAMETSQCYECGAAIGGSSHRLIDSNQSAQAFFQS